MRRELGAAGKIVGLVAMPLGSIGASAQIDTCSKERHHAPVDDALEDGSVVSLWRG
jgi:hypothetical protein